MGLTRERKLEIEQHAKEGKRRCTKCGEIKSFGEFHKEHRRDNGMRPECKLCASLIGKHKRKKYKENPYQRKKLAEKAKKRCLEYRDQWISWFKIKYGDSPKCEICGKFLIYSAQNGENKNSVVHWDHRNGGNELIKTSPSDWFRMHIVNPKNIEIFGSCNFGILCDQCNKALPTDLEKRRNFIEEALKYINRGDKERIEKDLL